MTAEGREHGNVLGAERRRLARAVTDDHEPDDVALRGEDADHPVPQPTRREHALETRRVQAAGDGQRDEAATRTASIARASASVTRTGRIRRSSSPRPALRNAVSPGRAGSSRISAYSVRNSRRAAMRSWRVPRSSAVAPSVSRRAAESCSSLSLLGALDAVPVHGQRARRSGGNEQDHGQRVAVVPADHRGHRHQAKGRPHGPGHERVAPRRARRICRSRHVGTLYRRSGPVP